MNEEVKIVLTEMCRVVGADYDSIDFHKERWFTQYSWTNEQENEFRVWLEDRLYKLPKNKRAEFMTFPSKNKKIISETVGWFIFNYGWTYNE